MSPVTRNSAWLASCHREQVTVFGIAARSGRKVDRGSKGKSPERPPRATRPRCCEASPVKNGTAGNVTEFRNERVTGDEREPLALPRGEKLGWRAQEEIKARKSKMFVSRMRRIRTVRLLLSVVAPRGPLQQSCRSFSGARPGGHRRKQHGRRGRSDEIYASGRLPR